MKKTSDNKLYNKIDFLLYYTVYYYIYFLLKSIRGQNLINYF